MKLRFFTFLVSFLTVMSGAVWGQEIPQTTDWNLSQNGQLNITSTGIHYRVTGDAPKTNDSHILVDLPNPSDEVHLTLAGASVDQNNDGDRSALSIQKGTVYLHLEDGTVNSMVSGHDRAGIYVSTNATLIIDGNGSLTAECAKTAGDKNALAAGIGGGGGGSYSPNFGTIWIKGGNITARSYSDGANAIVHGAHAYGAGIGGGQGSSEGTIIITGGTVNASCEDLDGYSTSGYYRAVGAAIGGGFEGTCTSIAILGGTVNARNVVSYGGDVAENIGMGNGYTGTNGNPNIILGKWDNSTTLTINRNNSDFTYNKGKYLNAINGTEISGNGTVTLPEGTQMYLTAAPTRATLNAYYVTFKSSKLQTEEQKNNSEHKVIGFPENKVDLYCGKNHSIEVTNALTCTQDHNFMGWLKGQEEGKGTSIIASKGEGDMFIHETGDTDPTGIDKTVYTSVWVDNIYPVLVKSGTEWKAEGKGNQIFTTPDAAKSLLTYTLPDLEQYPELNGKNAQLIGKNKLAMSGNYLTGAPTLSKGETYKQIDFDVKVKVNTSTEAPEKTVNVKMTIYDQKLLFTKVEKTDIEHTYNGNLHNDVTGEENHLLKVSAEIKEAGEGIAPSFDQIKEGIHYRIYGYTWKKYKADGNLEANGTPLTAEGQADNYTMPIKDAGEYSQIILEPLGENEFDSSFSPDSEGRITLKGITIIVEQKPVEVAPKEGQSCIVGGNVSNIEYSPAKDIETGIGKETYNYSGELSLEVNSTSQKGTYNILQNDLVFADATNNSGFKAYNYKMNFVQGVKFTVQKDITNDESIKVSAKELTYDGTPQTPEITVIDGSETLSLNTAYTISIEGADREGKVTNAEIYTVTIDGKGVYTGKITTTLKVNPKELTSVKPKDQIIKEGQQAKLNPVEDPTLIIIEDLAEKDKGNYMFSSGSLELTGENNKTISVKSNPALTLANNEEKGFLAANYIMPGSFGTGVLIVKDTEIEIDVPEGVEVDADGSWKFVYDGGHHKDAVETVKINGEDKALVPGVEYSVEYKDSENQLAGEKWNVGTYKAVITILKEGNNKNAVATQLIMVTERTLKINFLLDDESLIGKEVQAVSCVDYTTLNTGVNEGLVTNEIPQISGTFKIADKANENGKYDVEVKGLNVESSSSFSKANYNITCYVNGMPIDDNGDGNDNIEIDDPKEGDGDGGIIVSYHDLHIIKSVGAKLVSRYDKKRTPDGGSFTLSLEKEEGYEDCEPTVYYKRGRFGEWKEVKQDINGLYQIRSVYTDIFVKVSGDGIWPVSNEEVEAQEVKVYTQNGAIVVVTPSVMDVQVVSMTGSVVAADKVAGQREFRNLVEGVYIVRVEDEIVKVRL